MAAVVDIYLLRSYNIIIYILRIPIAVIYYMLQQQSHTPTTVSRLRFIINTAWHTQKIIHIYMYCSWTHNMLLYFVSALIRAFMCILLSIYAAIGQLIRITTIGSRPLVFITSGHDD